MSKTLLYRAICLSSAILLLSVVGFVCGPRVSVDPRLRRLKLPAIDALDEYLRKQESAVQPVPGTEKKIDYRHTDRQKTEYALVYVHGFSASRQDCRPVPQRVADHLKANAFHTRLTAHGQGAEAFARVSANDWLNDVHEAVEIGKRLGDRVVLMGHSTGATLCLWRAVERTDAEIAALVLLSPNFGIRNENAGIALYPWGKQIVRWFHGPYAGFSPKNDEHKRFWTERYRTEGVVQMIALVDFCCARDYAQFSTPCICFYSNQDRVISLKRLREKWTELDPSHERLHELHGSKGHALAGDILARETTASLTRKITEFLDEVLPLNGTCNGGERSARTHSHGADVGS